MSCHRNRILVRKCLTLSANCSTLGVCQSKVETKWCMSKVKKKNDVKNMEIELTVHEITKDEMTDEQRRALEEIRRALIEGRDDEL